MLAALDAAMRRTFHAARMAFAYIAARYYGRGRQPALQPFAAVYSPVAVARALYITDIFTSHQPSIPSLPSCHAEPPLFESYTAIDGARFDIAALLPSGASPNTLLLDDAKFLLFRPLAAAVLGDAKAKRQRARAIRERCRAESITAVIALRCYFTGFRCNLYHVILKRHFCRRT